ncbi:MAG: hypothetical protein IJ986_02705 [Bacteroidales bacterium]|nr:hypothetical protein [Bacteroidales bacterium]
MKKEKFKLYTIIAMVVVFMLWLLFLLIPGSQLIAGKVVCDSVNAAYVMAGALFTGLAFAATYISLLMQNKRLKEQLEMDTLSNSISLILNSDRFRESRKYVLSKTFIKHIEILKRMKGDAPICIEDWKDLDNEGNDSSSRDKDTNSYGNYEKLIFFCSRMEYMGIILKNKGIDNTFLDYFGNTIILSYQRLEPYIKNSREQIGITSYFHYTYLYYLAKQREPILEQECKDLLNKVVESKI